MSEKDLCIKDALRVIQKQKKLLKQMAECKAVKDKVNGRLQLLRVVDLTSQLARALEMQIQKITATRFRGSRKGPWLRTPALRELRKLRHRSVKDNLKKIEKRQK
jgi:hypothetical protein